MIDTRRSMASLAQVAIVFLAITGKGTAAAQLIPTTTSIWALSEVGRPCCPMPFAVSVSPSDATTFPTGITFLVDGNPSTDFFSGEGIFFASLVPGVHQVVARFAGSATHAPSESLPVTVTVLETSPPNQWFAEGSTGFFQTSIGVLNAGDRAEEIQVYLYPEGGSPADAAPASSFLLEPLARRTIDVNDVAGPIGAVSALVRTSGAVVVATRRMTWGAPAYGSTLESGAIMPARSWYFAEGATNAFSLFHLVLNPGPTPANVTLTHLLEGGGPPVVQHEVVPARARRTFFINDVPGLAFAALSTVVTADVPVVAERAMYLNTSGRLWEGGAASRGATSLNTNWSFAEGATGFFRTYLLLGNPASTDATATVTYQLADGSVITKTYPLPAQSRRTVDAAGEDPRLVSASFGMTVAATAPIVAERAMWWGAPFDDGSVSLGAPAARTAWGIGEGVDGGPTGASTFVLVANATAIAGQVRFTVVYDDGTNETRDYALLGRARLTVRVADGFVRARNARFSVIVESLSPDVTITVDSAEYQSGARFLDAGGAAPATAIR